MWLGLTWEIINVLSNNKVHIENKYFFQHSLEGIDSVCKKPKITHCDKIYITLITNIYKRTAVPVLKYSFDLSYGS